MSQMRLPAKMKQKFWWRHKRECKRCSKKFLPRSEKSMYCGNRKKKKGCQFLAHKDVVLRSKSNPNRKRIWRSKTEEQKQLRERMRKAMNKIWMKMYGRKVRKQKSLEEGHCPYCTMFISHPWHQNFPCKRWKEKNLSNVDVSKSS